MICLQLRICRRTKMLTASAQMWILLWPQEPPFPSRYPQFLVAWPELLVSQLLSLSIEPVQTICRPFQQCHQSAYSRPRSCIHCNTPKAEACWLVPLSSLNWFLTLQDSLRERTQTCLQVSCSQTYICMFALCTLLPL